MGSRFFSKLAPKGASLALGLFFSARPAPAQVPPKAPVEEASGEEVSDEEVSDEEVSDEEVSSDDDASLSNPAASDLRSVSIDDFDVPDEASFESLWDATWDPNLTFTSPHCSLDLAGGARTEALGESFFFYAVLSVPLRGCRPPQSEFSLPRGPFSEKPIKLVSVGSAEASDEAFPERRERPDATPPQASSSGPMPALPPLPKGFLEEFRRRVLEGRGLSRSEERIDSLIRREKAAGILPELRLRGAHGFDQSLALASVGALPGESTTRDGSDLLVEARLTFRLQRLLVGDSEVSLERSRQTLLDKAYDSLDDALDQLLIFRRASVLALASDATPEEKLDAELKAEGARIRLHVLTGGWFPLEGPLPGARKAPRD